MMKVSLLIIDAQNDFHSTGSLAVAGADEDSERVANMINSHMELIEDIYVTLDSHNPEHIAHAAFWNSREDGSGEQPIPFQRITHSDLINKVWFPVSKDLLDYCLEYTKVLEQKGRFTLTIWPQHCIVGTKGNDIVPSLQRAIDSWSAFHGKTVVTVRKGMNNLTEMYSAIEAEVPLPADPQTNTNISFVQQLKSANKLLVCGQALSHCVNYTTRDILKHWDPRNTADIILLLDAASAVYGCDEDAAQFVRDMKLSGLTLSTTDKVFLR